MSEHDHTIIDPLVLGGREIPFADRAVRAHSSSSAKWLLPFAQLVVDLVALNFTYHFILFLRFGSFFAVPTEDLGAPWAVYPTLEIYANVFWVAIATWFHLYRREKATNGASLIDLRKIRKVGRASLVLTGALLVVIVAQGGYNYYSRIFLAAFLAAAPLILISLRIVGQAVAHSARHPKSAKKNVLVIGEGETASEFAKAIAADTFGAYRLHGFLHEGHANGLTGQVLGGLSELDHLLEQGTIDEVVVADPILEREQLSSIIAKCENQCVRVAIVPAAGMPTNGSPTVERIGDVALVHLQDSPLDLLQNRIVKRVFDIVFSLLILVTIFPIVWLVSAIVIKLTSRGPVFFQQERTGEDGRTFVCYKFRTMRENPSAHLVQATRNDPRFTAIGRLLRRTSLDELPQFWNVLIGNMSVVGPRPHMLKHTEDYRNVISQYMVRHIVKPGVTGWAQVNGYRGETRDHEKMERRIKHDLFYIQNWSFLFDLTIVARTIVRLLRGDFSAY